VWRRKGWWFGRGRLSNNNDSPPVPEGGVLCAYEQQMDE